jgi:hypothetical protein
MEVRQTKPCGNPGETWASQPMQGLRGDAISKDVTRHVDTKEARLAESGFLA